MRLHHQRRTLLAVAITFVPLVLASCQTTKSPADCATLPHQETQPVNLTVLYTSDEHGWIAPWTEKGRSRGGAPELLTRWVRDEKHCIAGPNDDCTKSNTIALSGGDNWTGPAISSFFKGTPAAEVLSHFGYSASALGNHELDFGRATFDSNAKIQGITYLAANVSPDFHHGGVATPYRIVTRQGVRIAIIGLSTKNTPIHGLRSNYDGLSFGDEERSLEEFVPKAWNENVDAVAVIGHVCGHELESIIEKHPDWSLAFAGGGHCHKAKITQTQTAPIIEPGAFLRSYAKITMVIDQKKPAKQRVSNVHAELVDLTYPENHPVAQPDPTLANIVSHWQTRVQSALGETIGYTKDLLEPDSPSLVNLITDSWRDLTHADVAILNHSATRQSIPPGPITLQSIHSVLPFDNHLVTVKIKGSALLENLTCCNGHASGVKKQNGKIVFENGSEIDRDKIYTVVTTDFSYFGGSNFTFEKHDKSGVFGPDWRDPLIDKIRKLKTNEQRGIETALERAARL